MKDKRFCAEWEAQRGVVLAFPEADTDWAEVLEDARYCVVEIAQSIGRFEPVYLLTRSVKKAQSYFGTTKNITFIEADYNDTWMRDTIALSVEAADGMHFHDFIFNGWGGKFEAAKDNRLSAHLASKKVLGDLVHHDFVLEGGSVESDGKGTLLTTSSCLLNPNRNGTYTKSEVEAYLKAALGSERFLWLDHGHLEGDDTNGHIDTLARFCDSKTIAYVATPSKEDSHYESMLKMYQRLKSFRDSEGHPYRLVALPFVPPIYENEERLPATYANFLIINGAVLVPTYGVNTDQQALDILAGCFPDREIIGIDCRVLIKQHGSLHCMTMQLHG